MRLTLSGSNLTRNTAISTGGAFVSAPGTLTTIDNCRFDSNSGACALHCRCPVWHGVFVFVVPCGLLKVHVGEPSWRWAQRPPSPTADWTAAVIGHLLCFRALSRNVDASRTVSPSGLQTISNGCGVDSNGDFCDSLSIVTAEPFQNTRVLHSILMHCPSASCHDCNMLIRQQCALCLCLSFSR